jgi:glycosyltransferase involved in cell wall biosynthesis
VTALFWTSVLLVAYTYAGFPLLLWLRSRLAPRPFRVAEFTPDASLVICAYNEANTIAEKLENVLRLDYPRDRLEVIVASDGSTDGTEEIVASFAGRGVRLLALPRRGKIPTLNAAAALATGDVLVFSDANSMLEGHALRALFRPFADPDVGGVAGDQRYAGRAGRESGERAYWSLDRQLKIWQGRAGSVTSATGAIYAIRRELFRPVPAGVTDDFWISTRAIASGRRLVFAADAVAWEPPARSGDREFRRKVRVMTRGLRGVVLARELLNPLRHRFYALQILSHKVLRRLVVLPLVAILLASPWLWSAGPIYRAAILLQVLIYGLAAASALPLHGRLGRILALPGFFCMANAAAAVAAWNVVRGRRIDLWEPERDPAANELRERTT